MGRKTMNLKFSIIVKISEEDRKKADKLISDGINITQMVRNEIRKKHKEMYEEDMRIL